MFSEHNLERGDIDLTSVRCETWGGCVWINFDDDAPPLRQYLEPIIGILDAWKVESLRVEWWYSCRLPANWKLAQEAFVEQYHVLETHPQLRLPGRFPSRDGRFDSKVFIEAELAYLRLMNEGMAGMVHASDVRIAESLADIELPADPKLARDLWNRTLNEEVVRRHREAGHDMPDINELQGQGINEPMAYCFPHYLVLPMYSSASAYRFRPLGPEETLMEIWSLTRFPEGAERPRPTPPEVWDNDDARWPPIPAQDFSNLPRQQRGLHAKDFQYMRLSERGEGHISNYHRMIDGFLAGLAWERLLPAMHSVNVHPLEMPVLDLHF
jgi:phenylpropionate dioxygenase-like ring-hydroxylating dioxygenase large terminal subunit